MITSSTCVYARKATENATPRMLEKREIVVAPAPLDPLVGEAPAELPEPVPLLPEPEPVAFEPDAVLVAAARFRKSV